MKTYLVEWTLYNGWLKPRPMEYSRSEFYNAFWECRWAGGLALAKILDTALGKAVTSGEVVQIEAGAGPLGELGVIGGEIVPLGDGVLFRGRYEVQE